MKGIKGVNFLGDDDLPFGEPASSKDSLTRLQSPRNSKSGGTVVQRAPQASRARGELQIEECTSSASDQCPERHMQAVSCAVLPKISNVLQTNIHAKAGGTPSPISRDSHQFSASLERSQSSQSIAKRAMVGEETQSKVKRRHPEKQRPMSKVPSELCSSPPIPPDSLAEPRFPPAEPASQKLEHRGAKKREFEPSKVDPECSLLPDVVQPEVGKYDEDSRRVDQSAVVQQDPASKKRSDCVDEIAQTLAFTGDPPQSDATAPGDISHYQRKQRSRSSRKGIGVDASVPTQKSAKRQQSGAQKQLLSWHSGLRDATKDDDYRPSRISVDPDPDELRTPRLSRSRTQHLPEQGEDGTPRQRCWGFPGRTSDPLPSLNSLPTRSTRSQAIDFSPLWQDFYVPITPAKRMRGFNLANAVNKLNEVAEDAPASFERAPFSLERKPRIRSHGMEDADSLRQAVQLSLSAQTARREALADFLTPAVQPQGIERTDFAERWQGSKLAKAFMATTSQVPPLLIQRTDERICLPLDSLTDQHCKDQLDKWQQELNNNSGDPFQSSVRKRQQADVAHVWEDFLESQALEKSVLSDMTDCLHSRCREEDS